MDSDSKGINKLTKQKSDAIINSNQRIYDSEFGRVTDILSNSVLTRRTTGLIDSMVDIIISNANDRNIKG